MSTGANKKVEGKASEIPNDLRQIAMELQYYEQQAKGLQSQLQQMQGMFEETQGVLDALTNFSQMKSKTFQALGSGVLVSINVSDTKNVLVDIGSGVLLEQSVPAAQKILQDKVSTFENAIKEIQEALVSIVKKAELMQAKAEELSALEQKRQALFGGRRSA